MASKEKIVAVVDIGTTKVAAIAGIKNGENKIEVLGFAKAASKGIKRGVVLNIDEAVEVLNNVINQVEDQFDGEIRQLDVAIAGQQIKSGEYKFSRNISEHGIVTKEDISEMISEAMNLPIHDEYNYYHILPRNFTIDDEPGITNPIGSAGKKIEATFQMLAAPENYKFNVEMALDKISVDLRNVTLSPLATAEAVLTEDEKEAGVVLLDIGGGITKSAIFCDGVLCHTSVVPFGGNVITNDIKEGCSIIPRWAEQLKVQYGQAMGDFAEEAKVVTIPGYNGWEPKEISFKSLAFIIQARLEEILDSVYFQLENSGYMEKVGAGIVLTGGTSKLSNIVQLAKYRTGLDARIGMPVINLAEKNKDILIPEYYTALGLLKLSLDEMQDGKSKRERKKKEKKPSNGFLSGKMNKMKEKVSQGFIDFFDDSDVEM
ncbi:MAG: cell division protein FtsA [Mariniphaga sp.]|nr:cell division protein FtsA [Mariniphaga sp.]